MFTLDLSLRVSKYTSYILFIKPILFKFVNFFYVELTREDIVPPVRDNTIWPKIQYA